MTMARGEHPHDALPRGAPLVQPDADADLAIALALEGALGGHLAQRAALDVGQFEILEHDLDQLLQRNVGLVVVHAGPVAGLVLALALALLPVLPTTWPGWLSPSPWPTPGAFSP